MKTRTHVLVIPVKAPSSLSAKKVAHLVDRLIAIGWDDAVETDEMADPGDPECAQALKLEIGQCDPTVFKTK